MNRQECIYQRTDAGRRAWEDAYSGLPPAYRQILGLVLVATSANELIKALSDHPEKLILTWLDQMESPGIIACSFDPLSVDDYAPVLREVAQV